MGDWRLETGDWRLSRADVVRIDIRMAEELDSRSMQCVVVLAGREERRRGAGGWSDLALHLQTPLELRRSCLRSTDLLSRR